MAHSNSTQYYSLPQFDSTDKPAWLVDVNPAYAAIDAGIHAAKAAADDAQSDATQALSDASAAGTTASGADAKAAGSIASLADTFDPTATYNVGDLVMYNSLLYICAVEITVPGAWTGSTNWNRTTIESEINKKQDTIDRLTSVSTLNGTDKIAVYDGSNTKYTTAASVAGLIMLSNSSTWTALNESITAGNYYDIPADGLYVLSLAAVDTRAAEFSINNVGIIANTTLQAMVSQNVFLKAGTRIYTRNISGQTYQVRGYWS